jgi:hypothetical protein
MRGRQHKVFVDQAASAKMLTLKRKDATRMKNIFLKMCFKIIFCTLKISANTFNGVQKSYWLATFFLGEIKIKTNNMRNFKNCTRRLHSKKVHRNVFGLDFRGEVNLLKGEAFFMNFFVTFLKIK